MVRSERMPRRTALAREDVEELFLVVRDPLLFALHLLRQHEAAGHERGAGAELALGDARGRLRAERAYRADERQDALGGELARIAHDDRRGYRGLVARDRVVVSRSQRREHAQRGLAIGRPRGDDGRRLREPEARLVERQTAVLREVRRLVLDRGRELADPDDDHATSHAGAERRYEVATLIISRGARRTRSRSRRTRARGASATRRTRARRSCAARPRSET